jgi:hypothetical protein
LLLFAISLTPLVRHFIRYFCISYNYFSRETEVEATSINLLVRVYFFNQKESGQQRLRARFLRIPEKLEL